MATSTYNQTNTAQACALNNYCSSSGGTIEAGRQAEIGATAGSTEVTFSVAASQADDNEYSWEIILPASATSDADNATVRMNFTTGHMDVTWESCFICRVNSSCVNQETIGSGTALGISTNAGAQSTVISCSAVTFSAGDKVIITCGFSNAGSHSARTIGVTPSSTHTLPFNAPAASGWGALINDKRNTLVLNI